LYKSYNPTPDALDIIRERIAFRISEKQNWYRWSPHI